MHPAITATSLIYSYLHPFSLATKLQQFAADCDNKLCLRIFRRAGLNFSLLGSDVEKIARSGKGRRSKGREHKRWEKFHHQVPFVGTKNGPSGVAKVDEKVDQILEEIVRG